MTFVGSMSGTSGTSSSYSMPQNTNSIQGLASGLDTQKIVDGLVQGAQAPLVSLLQQRQQLMWKSEEYQQVNSALQNLQTSLSNMSLQSSFLAKQTSSTNSSVVSASASNLAPNGSYTVSVSQLASAATISSQSSLSTNSDYGNIALDNLPSNAITGGVFNITVNGQSIAIDPSTDTINTVLQKITSDTATGVSGFYDANSGKVVMQTTSTGSSAHIQLSTDATSKQLFNSIMGLSQPQASTLTSGTFSGSALTSGGQVEINGTKFSFTSGETLSSVVSAINTANISGVTAVNNGNGTFSLQTAGLYSPLNLSDPNNVLQLPSLTVPNGDTASQDASYSVNGISSTSSTNNPVFNGVTLNLGGTTTSGNPVTISVSPNTQQVVKSITDFVQTYNQTLQTLQGMYNQRRDYSYKPLTASQESQMTQRQIDEWNQKAQAGLLSYNPAVGQALNSVENAASTELSGLTNNSGITSLSSIGIKAISPINGVDSGYTAPGVNTKGWNTYGLLEVNTTTLTQEVQSNPQAVMNLFTNTASTSSTTTLGLAKQMYNAVTNSMTAISQDAGPAMVDLPTTPNSNTGKILLPSTPVDPNANLSSLFSTDNYNTSLIGEQISSIDTQALAMQKQISTQRSRWQSQFAQMEQTIQTLNSEQSQLVGMLS